jgi:hypothetical protein
VPITLSDGLSGERHKLTNTQIRTSCKKQPGFATQSGVKRTSRKLPKLVVPDPMRHFVTVIYRIAKGSFALDFGRPTAASIAGGAGAQPDHPIGGNASNS